MNVAGTNIRDQYNAQCRRAATVSKTRPRSGIAVVMRKSPGKPVIGIFGDQISWGSIEVWRARYRILRMYQGGEFVT